MPLLINKAKHLITINVTNRDAKTGKVEVKKYPIIPGTGKPTAVPKEALSLRYVISKIAKGELEQVADPAAKHADDGDKKEDCGMGGDETQIGSETKTWQYRNGM